MGGCWAASRFRILGEVEDNSDGRDAKRDPELSPPLQRCINACVDTIMAGILTDSDAVYVEGILRTPGQHSRWNALVDDIKATQGQPDKNSLLAKESNIHNVCSALKAFLREAQSACGTLLAPQEAYGILISAKDEVSVRKGLLLLAPSNRAALQAVVKLCKELCARKRTRMTPRACAVVLAPNLVYDDGDKDGLLQRIVAHDMKSLFKVLIACSEAIFEGLDSEQGSSGEPQ